eukprot:3188856-Heterocapsa_arctica.AAC.1
MSGIGDVPSRAESTVTRLPLQLTGLFRAGYYAFLSSICTRLEWRGMPAAGPTSVGCGPRGLSATVPLQTELTLWTPYGALI